MKIFFSLLLVLATLTTTVLLITSLILLFKKSSKTKKFLKFTGMAFVLTIISFVGINMSMTPEEKQEIQDKQKADAKLRNEEAQKTKEQKEAEEKKLAEEQKKAEEKQKEFTSYAQNIRGGSFIKDMKLNNKDVEITFHDSFASYKSAKPDSNVTEEQYKQYFSTGDAIEKMFVSEPARLLRQFPDLNTVKMTLPFDGKTYSASLERTSLNSYLGFKIEDLKVEDQSWSKKFNNQYVYNKSKRTEFFNHFVTIQ
ncbi:hypothetical protein [Bacillus cereus]|uniref:hypothetical protein n=1 Tax=Bacillus cereus TaxID=1396 RepID=UPI000BF53515|nr:hypothetical protein [Bacillus cereus]PFD67314.1 hypothetical protein CN301_27990 [Bacillus cereus]